MAKKQIEEKMLTVSEIAKMAGVSRNLVWAYIRKNKIKPVVKEKKNFKFDSSVVLKIKQKQKRKQEEKNEQVENKGVSGNVLEILHEQLKIKDKQIEKQNETIDFLRSEVISARLEAKKNQKLLDDAKKKEEAVSANELNKKKWWHFW